MLEIKNLTKVYKTKGGADTKALDNVSIRFEEKGLVFLLGKSGSGKSTLLNVAGGLDEPTSGEVVVMGKSSREFSGSDFDSYRNTYVGFVFQEYNVLNEFNVEDNIALALELQGKPKDKQKIAELLRDVELERFAKRKPNTLSGGQKQRIAIARALIKDPQIIMADEPTGALDSATGKQVFDTLKKLSETRLVIVVSHDREFAEIYGDRIVELKDGKIISDMTKAKTPARKIGDNVTQIGENTLSIKSGAKLTEANLREIQRFVASAGGDVIISKGQEEIANFKKANRIDDSGSRERFDDTQEDKLDIKTYDKGDAKFIRSKLPARKAIKIGASGLKLKPFRLVFTVLLSFVAFVMFGLFSTMMFYDGEEVKKTSFMNSDYNYLAIEKYYRSNVTMTWSNGGSDVWENYYNNAYFTPAEVQKFNGFGAYSIYGRIDNVSFNGDSSAYYQINLQHAAVVPEGNALRSTLQGSYPANSKEICISSFLFESFKNGEYRILDENGKYQETTIGISSPDQILGTYIQLSGNLYKITGIFNSGSVPQKYEDLKSSGNNGSLSYDYSNYMRASLHSCIFVSQDYTASGNNEYVQYFDYAEKEISLTDGVNDTETDIIRTNEIQVYGKEGPALNVIFLDQQTSRSSLADTELIIRLEGGFSIVQNNFEKQQNEIQSQIDELQSEIEEKYNELRELENEDDRAQLENEISELESQKQPLYDELSVINNLLYNVYYKWQSIIYNGEYWSDEQGTTVSATEQEIAQAKDEFLQTLKECDLSVKCSLDGFSKGTYTVVGIYFPPDNGYYYNGIYCSQALYDEAGVYTDGMDETNDTKYVAEDDAIYSSIFVPFDRTEQSYNAIFSLLGTDNINPDTDVWYELDNPLGDSVETANYMVGTLSTVFLWVGVVMALFAALLLFNFISMSISNKKKDIGILRAVGARGFDVFKIFFAESGIIVGICALLSIVGTFVLTGVLNNILKAEIGLQVTLFVFGWLSIVLMAAVAIAVALIATFLPVYFAAKKKPVESIRAL